MNFICGFQRLVFMKNFQVTNREPKEVVRLIKETTETSKSLKEFIFKKYEVGIYHNKNYFLNISREFNYGFSKRFYCNCSKEEIISSVKGIQKLKSISKISLNNPKFVFKRVFTLIFNKELYLIALDKLKNRGGYGTPGVDGEGPDGFSLLKLSLLLQKIESQRYKFKPLRKVYIPKSKGKGYRILGTPSFRDKIVQEVIRIILESIFDPTFSS